MLSRRLSHSVPLHRAAKLVDVPLMLRVTLAMLAVSLLKRAELQSAVALKSLVPLVQAVASQGAVAFETSAEPLVSATCRACELSRGGGWGSALSRAERGGARQGQLTTRGRDGIGRAKTELSESRPKMSEADWASMMVRKDGRGRKVRSCQDGWWLSKRESGIEAGFDRGRAVNECGRRGGRGEGRALPGQAMGGQKRRKRRRRQSKKSSRWLTWVALLSRPRAAERKGVPQS